MLNAENTPLRSIAVLDFETTDLTPQAGAVIEGAVVRVEILPDGRLGEKLEEYASFNDPGIAIPEEITQITGITDEMARGHKLDWERFNSILARADLLVSHNASFDRAWLEHHGKFKGPRWACSLKMIDWSQAHRMPCRTLKHLAWEHDLFPNAHRALDDVNTLVFLLGQACKSNPSRTYVQEMIENSAIKRMVVFATASPFESKDVLKENQFRWSPEKRVWWKIVPESEIPALARFMEEKVYKGTPRHTVSQPIDPLDPDFRARMGVG